MSLYKHHFCDAFFVFTTYMTRFLLKYWSLPVISINASTTVAGLAFGIRASTSRSASLSSQLIYSLYMHLENDLLQQSLSWLWDFDGISIWSFFQNTARLLFDMYSSIFRTALCQ
ncbi:Hypothetical_protein [Hexamita inflata]|uniref:Hypothetical_protein n=1 Tax=Hexamita inflata TaxID=28002 RepID=A0ABP1KIM5_9EUKA